MEKGQSEVTNKIRSAIKKKLAEISEFVDDELPEYIMILVANQRSKSQIEKDLSLFLRNDTVNFTNWLWDLLNNLKVCTKNSQSSVSKTESVAIKKNVETDEDAVILEFDPDEHETDFLSHEDTNDSILSKSSIRPSSIQTNVIKEPPITKSTRNHKVINKDKVEPKSPIKIRKSVPIQSSKEPLSSAVIPVKRKISDIEDEYDPTKPEYKKSCNSNARKYAGAAALQANKLLLKAVDDAAKSILHGKNLEDFYKPTPIKVLTSKRFCNPSLCKTDNLQRKRISVHKTIVPQLELIPDVPDASEFEAKNYLSDVLMEEDDTSYEVSQNSSHTICLTHVPLISDTSELEDIGYINRDNYEYSFADLEEVRPKSPHFIVTLDGVTRSTFRRKFENDSVDSTEEVDTDKEDEPSSDEIVSTSEKKKLNERCKYWPACKNSDHCSYHHPTVACKCFPDCKFGDKCLYIHPNCKFDALCSRKDCPFTHASKRKLPFIAVPMKIPVKSRRMKIVCKFYPKCTSKNCPFIHPKLCRYGTDCRLPTCLFGHFPVPSRSQMKWHAALS